MKKINIVLFKNKYRDMISNNQWCAGTALVLEATNFTKFDFQKLLCVCIEMI